GLDRTQEGLVAGKPMAVPSPDRKNPADARGKFWEMPPPMFIRRLTDRSAQFLRVNVARANPPQMPAAIRPMFGSRASAPGTGSPRRRNAQPPRAWSAAAGLRRD